MRQFKMKSCIICNTDFIPTGNCCKVCETCRPGYQKLYHKHYREMNINTGVGKGGANKKGVEHPQFKTGMGNFHSLRRFLKESINHCQRCGKDLSEASRYEWCVHHKDRDRTHNVLENLELLCKRCHQLEHDCYSNLNK